jgi:hypothetical protein
MKKLIFLIVIQANIYSQPKLKEIYDYMVEKECIYPEIHLKVIVLETGWLKYGGNNLCGWNPNPGFKHWKECIDYLKNWQDTHFTNHVKEEHNNNTECDYYHFLRWRGYKTGKKHHPKETGYTDYLKRIKINLE